MENLIRQCREFIYEDERRYQKSFEAIVEEHSCLMIRNGVKEEEMPIQMNAREY